MRRCACEPDNGGERLALWLIIADGNSGRVIRCKQRSPLDRTDEFLRMALITRELYGTYAPSAVVKMSYAHSMECLRERNPGYIFPVLISA